MADMQMIGEGDPLTTPRKQRKKTMEIDWANRASIDISGDCMVIPHGVTKSQYENMPGDEEVLESGARYRQVTLGNYTIRAFDPSRADELKLKRQDL